MPAFFEPLVPFGGMENIVALNSLGLEKESWLISVGFGEAVLDFMTANHQLRHHRSTRSSFTIVQNSLSSSIYCHDCRVDTVTQN